MPQYPNSQAAAIRKSKQGQGSVDCRLSCNVETRHDVRTGRSCRLQLPLIAVASAPRESNCQWQSIDGSARVAHSNQYGLVHGLMVKVRFTQVHVVSDL